MAKFILNAAGVAVLLGLGFVLLQIHPLMLVLLAPAMLIIWLVVPLTWDNVAFALHDGRPDFLFRSRRDPPWRAPRRVSEIGNRRDRADFRSLRARLNRVPEDEPRDPSDNLAPETYRDDATGQYWREEKFEHGFNQWRALAPVPPPGSGAPTP